MKTYLIISILVILMGIPLRSEMVFKKTGQWNHGDKGIYVQISTGVIDKDGHIIIRAERQKTSILITPANVFYFAPWGESGDDIYLGIAQCLYKDDLAIVEVSQRVKIFAKKNDKYTWEKTAWIKNKEFTQTVRCLIFFKDKWFLAGPYPLERYKEGQPLNIAFLRIMDKEFNPLKELIISKVKNNFKYHQMDFYVAADGNRVLYLSEDELKVHVVSPETLEVTKEILLKVPGYYKKMPEDFYVYKKQYYNDSKAFVKDWQFWQTSYSRIENVIIEDGFLVIQTRTCDEKLKKFALLFYDLNTFDLKLTYFVDDMLLGSRDGKYYFYANGNPGKDEEADKCIINIYAFEDKK